MTERGCPLLRGKKVSAGAPSCAPTEGSEGQGAQQGVTRIGNVMRAPQAPLRRGARDRGDQQGVKQTGIVARAPQAALLRRGLRYSLYRIKYLRFVFLV